MLRVRVRGRGLQSPKQMDRLTYRQFTVCTYLAAYQPSEFGPPFVRITVGCSFVRSCAVSLYSCQVRTCARKLGFDLRCIHLSAVSHHV